MQAKTVGDLIRNYKPLSLLCLMQRVLFALLAGSFGSIAEIIDSRRVYPKLRYSRRKTESAIENRNEERNERVR